MLGLQKFVKDRDIAKFLDKLVPNLAEHLEGIHKVKSATGASLLLKSEESFTHLATSLGDQKFRGRSLNLKPAQKTWDVKKFKPLKDLLKSREQEMHEPTEEDLKEAWGLPLRDKLVPYHSIPYEEQLEKKATFLKDVMSKFVARIGKECNQGDEKPMWL